ncbi:hypothetical protein FRC03_009836 [Tulasnella sp. 419]|nr:hypothetical protein FRC02_008332 [Tulasnella sp. 418]KAG8957764.1 hypothetical protein FRC03_009836 [Tulasnella sp. 419]
MDVFERNPDLKSAAIRTKSYQLTLGQVVRKGPGPIAQGSYGEVWKGLLYNKEPSFPWRSNATEVAIKVIKLPQQDHERLLKRLFREVLPVHDLEHPNILPLTGYVMHRNEAWIVTPWQKWGNAMQYLKTNPGVNRLKLIVDIVKGLNHLHSRKPPTIHSDLKGDNILIGDDGVARLSDFGLADLLDESLEASFRTSSFLSGCIHFLAPELLAGERKTVESDIWALGGLILQIASSRLPYFYLNRMQVLSALCINQIPDVRQYGRFKHDDRLWPIIMGCWKINPKERWTASQILSYLESHFSPAERT